jgi:cytochrome c-type biogenesis protein CcmH/NrfG
MMIKPTDKLMGQSERVLAYKTEKRSHSPVDGLREALDKAERQVVSPDANNIEKFLILLDTIEQQIAELAATQADVRPEQGRWESLLARLSTKPEPIVAAATKVGGLKKLRAQHPPAESFWWHMDAEVTRRRVQAVRRFIITAVAIVGAVVFLLWGVDYLFPPDPNTILMVNATSDVEQLVAEQKWGEALKRVQTVLKTLPNEPELLIWEGVLYEQLGDTSHAKASLDHAQALTKDQQAGFWILVGNKRFQVGNLNGAEEAGNLVLKIAPEEPQGMLLLAGVAEARGDNAKAIDLFSKTAELARKTNNAQLEVIAKMRMGTLMQQVNPFASSPVTATNTLSTPTTPISK